MRWDGLALTGSGARPRGRAPRGHPARRGDPWRRRGTAGRPVLRCAPRRRRPPGTAGADDRDLHAKAPFPIRGDA
ncbi:hypothetical protein SUDANB6_00807 [Streptomyces sp. enrichment culture]|uniref:hypothetical protein n=1 Tax=Streptomyces sp. enrichment culture TaxID=1795815 RepID=UPI003F54E89B